MWKFWPAKVHVPVPTLMMLLAPTVDPENVVDVLSRPVIRVPPFWIWPNGMPADAGPSEIDATDVVWLFKSNTVPGYRMIREFGDVA